MREIEVGRPVYKHIHRGREGRDIYIYIYRERERERERERCTCVCIYVSRDVCIRNYLCTFISIYVFQERIFLHFHLCKNQNG